MIMYWRPRRIVEIGSGYSTVVVARAIQELSGYGHGQSSRTARAEKTVATDTDSSGPSDPNHPKKTGPSSSSSATLELFSRNSSTTSSSTSSQYTLHVIIEPYRMDVVETMASDSSSSSSRGGGGGVQRWPKQHSFRKINDKVQMVSMY